MTSKAMDFENLADTLERIKNKKNVEKKIDKSYVKTKKKLYRLGREIFELYHYYKPTKILGRGAYGVVCEAIDLRTGKVVAIKKNISVFNDVNDAKSILRELNLLIHFNHIDIVQLLDVQIPTNRNKFKDIYLVMPRMETTLSQIFQSRQQIGTEHVQYFLYQLCRGMQHIHSAGVMHRDLKPENVLVNTHDCNLKITDFGLSRGVASASDFTEYVCTRWYRAPEVFCSNGSYSYPADIWSIACIFGELYLRKPLFPGKNYISQLKLICAQVGSPKHIEPWMEKEGSGDYLINLRYKGRSLRTCFPSMTADARDLLTKMLVLNPNRRASLDVALKHRFLSDQYCAKELSLESPAFNTDFEHAKSLFGIRHAIYTNLEKYGTKFDHK
eukprot:UN32322